MTRRRWSAAIAVAALAVAGCTEERGGLPPPSVTASTAEVTTTTRPDVNSLTLPVVPGSTTTTLLGSGSATVQGTVLGPDGVVEGATVRIERLVGTAVQGADVVSGPDGTWLLAGVPGGRYRVRAFRVPDLVQPSGSVFFMADGEVRDVRLEVVDQSGLEVRSGVTPAQPTAGGGVNVAVRVTERVVGDDGVGRSVPRPATFVRAGVSGFEPVGPLDGFTDADGRVVFELRCPAATATAMTVFVGDGEDRFSLPVPACAPVTTTTTAPPTTTTGSTTTTEP